MEPLRRIAIRKLGKISYGEALRLQEVLATKRKAGTLEDMLLVLQHHPVFTVGKRKTVHNLLKTEEELRELGAEVHHVLRGGDVTWHGPGQIVLYPILNLRQLRLGARRYVENLEDVMIKVAAQYGLEARGRLPEQTGVWVGERKIGAVGVRISGGITSHGLAFNVDPDLSWYNHIVPCGIADKEVTSVRRECEEAKLVDVGTATEQLIKAFKDIFKLDEQVHNS